MDINTIIAILEELYPDPTCALFYDKSKPYQLLIATRLSAQCTDIRVNLVTPILFAKFQTLQELADANVEDIENIIRTCGLFKTKASDIKIMSRQLLDDFDGNLPNTLEQLTSLRGIGSKTANLIIGDIFKQPAVVTDTHCIRISNRLGFVNSTNPAIVEKKLRAILPPDKSSDFCHRLVIFGREYCKAQNPQCDKCPIQCQFSTKL